MKPPFSLPVTLLAVTASLSADTTVRIPCGSFHPPRYIVAVTCGAHM